MIDAPIDHFEAKRAGVGAIPRPPFGDVPEIRWMHASSMNIEPVAGDAQCNARRP